jgi:hypothetical protein
MNLYNHEFVSNFVLKRILPSRGRKAEREQAGLSS